MQARIYLDHFMRVNFKVPWSFDVASTIGMLLVSIPDNMPTRSPHLIIPLSHAAAALVEYCHGFISRSNLNLHEISFIMRTMWTLRFSSINIFPGIRSSQYVIDFFSFQLNLACILSRNIVRVWTSWTTKPH